LPICTPLATIQGFLPGRTRLQRRVRPTPKNVNRHQLDLFADYNPEPPSQAYSPTSQAATESIEPRAETLRRDVLDCIRRHQQLAEGGFATAVAAKKGVRSAITGESAIISSYLGKADIFDRALAAFAINYADQVERDYEAFAQAVSEGKLEACIESKD
jgi:hypothetical protein